MSIFISSKMRVMGLMARVAEHSAGVLGGRHLGEGLGFGGVFLVAAAAEIGDIRQNGLVGGRVVDMLRQRTVASLASDMSVLAGRAGLPFVLMAEQAHLLSRVRDRALADGVERAWAVMSIAAETFRYDRGADHQKETEPGQQYQRGANQMA